MSCQVENTDLSFTEVYNQSLKLQGIFFIYLN